MTRDPRTSLYGILQIHIWHHGHVNHHWGPSRGRGCLLLWQLGQQQWCCSSDTQKWESELQSSQKWTFSVNVLLFVPCHAGGDPGAVPVPTKGLAKQSCGCGTEAGCCVLCMAMAVNVLPFVSQSTGDDLLAVDHCPCPYKIPTVALSATPLPLAADDHVLLLMPQLPLCWDALGCTLLPRGVCDHLRVFSPSTRGILCPAR